MTLRMYSFNLFLDLERQSKPQQSANANNTSAPRRFSQEDSIIKSSRLSASAPEFVPSGMGQYEVRRFLPSLPLFWLCFSEIILLWLCFLLRRNHELLVMQHLTLWYFHTVTLHEHDLLLMFFFFDSCIGQHFLSWQWKLLCWANPGWYGHRLPGPPELLTGVLWVWYWIHYQHAQLLGYYWRVVARVGGTNLHAGWEQRILSVY